MALAAAGDEARARHRGVHVGALLPPGAHAPVRGRPGGGRGGAGGHRIVKKRAGARAQGREVLRAAGIEVAVANGAACRACALSRTPPSSPGRSRACPHVTLKLATSLDGKIATASGESQWISGPAARALVHRWRPTTTRSAWAWGRRWPTTPPDRARRQGATPAGAVVFDSAPACRCGSARRAPGPRGAPVIVLAAARRPARAGGRARGRRGRGRARPGGPAAAGPGRPPRARRVAADPVAPDRRGAPSCRDAGCGRGGRPGGVVPRADPHRRPRGPSAVGGPARRPWRARAAPPARRPASGWARTSWSPGACAPSARRPDGVHGLAEEGGGVAEVRPGAGGARPTITGAARAGAVAWATRWRSTGPA